MLMSLPLGSLIVLKTKSNNKLKKGWCIKNRRTANKVSFGC